MKAVTSIHFCLPLILSLVILSAGSSDAVDFSSADDLGGKAPLYQLLALFQASAQRGDAEMLTTICTPLLDTPQSSRESIKESFESRLSRVGMAGEMSPEFSDFSLEIDSISLAEVQATAFVRSSWPVAGEARPLIRRAQLSFVKISGRWQFSSETELTAVMDLYLSSASPRSSRSSTDMGAAQSSGLAVIVQADRLLNPVAFLETPYIPRATLVYSMMYLDSQRLFGCPTSVTSFKLVSSPSLSHDAVAISDFCWRRIFACDLHLDHSYFITKGGFGHAPTLDDFAQPCGMEFMGSGLIYVAEDVNNRIKVVETNSASEEKLSLFKMITLPEFNRPTDVDVSWPDQYGERSVVVANSGANNLVVFDDEEPWPPHNIRVHTGAGSSLGPFVGPSSVAFGRDPISSQKNQFAYFVDSDGTRIVRIANWSLVPSLYISYSNFPAGTNLSSIGVDNEGEVWAVDKGFSKIYKFNKDLVPIAKHGFFGSGDAEYLHPNSISFSQGYDENTEQILANLAEVLVTEDWTASTGVRRLVLGTEIFNGSVNFRPRLLDGTAASVYGSYLLTGYANVTEELIGPAGNIVETHQSLMWPSGNKSFGYTLSTALPSGAYKVRITSTSIYSNSNSDQVTLTISVDNTTINQRPTISNIWFPNGDSCVLLNHQVPITVTANDPDGSIAFYDWYTDPAGIGYFEQENASTVNFVLTTPLTNKAEPHYLKVMVYDNYSQQSLPRSLNLDAIDHEIDFYCICTWMPGDANWSHTYSISDVVKIRDYVFGVGNPPRPVVMAGDADCNHAVSISDVVFLVNYIFQGGPAPPCTCQYY